VKKLLRRFCTWVADKFSSRPIAKSVHASLTELYKTIQKNQDGQTSVLNTRSGLVVPFDIAIGKFIIFSDQHKGAGDHADDFVGAKENYAAALDYYYQNGFTFINLGDSEELWENKPEPVLQCYEKITQQEVLFQKSGRYLKVFGNHDLLWFDKAAVKQFLAPLFSDQLQVYEGIILQTMINGQLLQVFLTHGHQGDAVSDSNAFSKWFIGRIWVPVQRWLDFNVNTPAKDFHLRDQHNQIMYNWTKGRQNVILITGHTHKPVFESLDHLQRLAKQLESARQQDNALQVSSIEKEIAKKKAEYGKDAQVPTEAIRPAYYNTGCCCFNDGDITGIEIEDGELRLVRWHTDKETKEIKRQICESASLQNIAAALA
jgi:UDP-2,3-diacylglucosamine pyrophosphatase LpxH